jgi:hypothetical protein
MRMNNLNLKKSGVLKMEIEMKNAIKLIVDCEDKTWATRRSDCTTWCVMSIWASRESAIRSVGWKVAA